MKQGRKGKRKKVRKDGRTEERTNGRTDGKLYAGRKGRKTRMERKEEKTEGRKDGRREEKLYLLEGVDKGQPVVGVADFGESANEVEVVLIPRPGMAYAGKQGNKDGGNKRRRGGTGNKEGTKGGMETNAKEGRAVKEEGTEGKGRRNQCDA